MNTPTLDKIKRIQENSQAIGNFIEWLEASMGIVLCKQYKNQSEHYEIVGRSVSSITELLAKHFEIDLAAAERERRKILGHLRRQSSKKPSQRSDAQ